MKTRIFIFFIFLASSLLAQVDTPEKIIQLINKTGYNIISVQLSPAGKNTWNKNILVSGVFEIDEKEIIRFTPENASQCKYDVKATKINGEAIIFNDLNLCHLLNVTLYFEDQTAYLRQNMIIENQTQFSFAELYVSPSEMEFWSNNLLHPIVLNQGEETRISFTPSTEDCFYDIQVKRLSGMDVIFQNLYLCKTFKVTLYYGEGRPYFSYWDFR